ncbi:MAG: hypothetical protein KAS32_28220, partial [Candidatus Peribacteraceae bacterium]|nr:hypothetical protein [Candidatus Peribacteraceae bacterium]
ETQYVVPRAYVYLNNELIALQTDLLVGSGQTTTYAFFNTLQNCEWESSSSPPVIRKGPPVSGECTDNDPNQDPFTKGFCIDIHDDYVCKDGCDDMCDKGYLYDFFCHTRDGKTYCASNRASCPSGYVCSDGVCVKEGGGTQPAYCSESWSKSSVPDRGGIWSIAYGDGVVVAVGDPPNPISRSTNNGKTWSSVSYSVGTSEHIVGLAYGGESFVSALMRAGEIIKSDDGGVTWNTVYNVGESYGDLIDIAYGNGRFVVAWPDGKISTSQTGESGTWTTINNNNFIRSISYGNGKFLMGTTSGNILETVDGSSVNVIGKAGQRGDTITHCSGNKWISAGIHEGGYCVSSDNGKTWTCDIGLMEGDAKFYSSIYVDGNFFIAGDHEKGETNSRISVTTDCGDTWHTFKSGLTSTIVDMEKIGSMVLIANPHGDVAYSQNPVPDYSKCTGTGNTCSSEQVPLVDLPSCDNDIPTFPWPCPDHTDSSNPDHAARFAFSVDWKCESFELREETECTEQDCKTANNCWYTQTYFQGECFNAWPDDGSKTKLVLPSEYNGPDKVVLGYRHDSGKWWDVEARGSRTCGYVGLQHMLAGEPCVGEYNAHDRYSGFPDTHNWPYSYENGGA